MIIAAACNHTYFFNVYSVLDRLARQTGDSRHDCASEDLVCYYLSCYLIWIGGVTVTLDTKRR